MTRARIRLIHARAGEARACAERLHSAGFGVAWQPFTPALLADLRKRPPDAVLIDLERAPSVGRDVALQLRQRRTTRFVPLLFAGGDPATVAQIRALLPDAGFTSWRGVRGALARALARPPAEAPVAPGIFAPYAGVPLPRKLGIRPGSAVALVGAPRDFEETLGALPEGARLRRRLGRADDLVLWFPGTRRELERRVAQMREHAGKDGLWIAWAKQASGVATDLTQVVVRRAGLANGLVDYKISAIGATWSGLRFRRRER